MAQINVSGLEIFLANMQKMSNDARAINRGALGEGAKVAAEEMRNTLEQLPIRPETVSAEDHDRALYGVTANELTQILDNFGITRFKDTSGGWNTSIGVSGYVNTHSPMWGNKVPTKLLLAVVENGSVDENGAQFRKPCHVLKQNESQLEAAVTEAMQNYIDQAIKKSDLSM